MAFAEHESEILILFLSSQFTVICTCQLHHCPCNPNEIILKKYIFKVIHQIQKLKQNGNLAVNLVIRVLLSINCLTG